MSAGTSRLTILLKIVSSSMSRFPSGGCFLQLRHRVERPQSDTRPAERGGATRLPVDDAKRRVDFRAEGAQVFRGSDDLTTGSDDVLDHHEPAAGDFATFGEPPRAVFLRLLAHAEERQPGQLG